MFLVAAILLFGGIGGGMVLGLFVSGGDSTVGAVFTVLFFLETVQLVDWAFPYLIDGEF